MSSTRDAGCNARSCHARNASTMLALFRESATGNQSASLTVWEKDKAAQSRHFQVRLRGFIDTSMQALSAE